MNTIPEVIYGENASYLKNTPRHLINKRIGTLTVAGKVKHTRQYEVAAWSTDMEAIPGTYDLFIGLQYYGHITTMQVYAKLKATVTDDNCAPLFGGVAFAPARKDRVGTEDSFEFSMPALKAIHRNASTYDEQDGVLLILDAAPELLTEFCNVALMQSAQLSKYLENCIHSEVTKKDWGMVAHYADSLRNHLSAERCARYTITGQQHNHRGAIAL